MDKTGNTQDTFKIMGKHKTRLVAILVFLLLASLALVMFIINTPPQDSTPIGSTGHAATIQLDPGAGVALSGGYQGKTHEEILEELQGKQVLVTDTISSHASFATGTPGELGEWIVENIPKNTVVQQAEIFLDGKCIARSAAIQPGQHIRQVRLLETVPKGTYDVVAYLNYFTQDTQSYISKAGFNIKMTVHR